MTAPAESQPEGPEDQPHPDKERQQRDPGGTSEHERHPEQDRDRGRSDLDGGAWHTEATFEGDPTGKAPRRPRPRGRPDEPDVDPIVHRGE
jgi:hypothetical protein